MSALCSNEAQIPPQSERQKTHRRLSMQPRFQQNQEIVQLPPGQRSAERLSKTRS